MAAGDALDAVSAEFHYAGGFQPAAGAGGDAAGRQRRPRGARGATDLEDNRGGSPEKPADCPVHGPGYPHRGGSLREKADAISAVAGVYGRGRRGQIRTAVAADCGIYRAHADSPR